MNTRKLILSLIIAASFISSSFAQEVRVEPPFWWANMPSTSLQLMIHHPGIQEYNASINHSGIRILRQQAGDSPNYLFVYLEISPDVKAGEFEIKLQNGSSSLTVDYTLKQRSSDVNRNLGFNSSDVIYLLMPDRFANADPDNDTIEGMLESANRSDPSGRHGGDIEGAKQHLDYIKSLGMTAVWLTPVFENDMTPQYKAYHGYAATDMYKIDRRFGSNQEFNDFVQACHDKGLKVIMDMIHNHIGDQHWWMKDLPTKDWVHDFDIQGQTNFRGAVQSDPYQSQFDLDQLEKGWFVPEMPDLNQRNPLVADYLIQNTMWWIEESGVDGIRMDTYVYPYKDYMARWAKEVLEAYPNFNIVGESWVEGVSHESYWQRNPKGMDDGYNSNLKSVTDFQILFALQRTFREDFGWTTGIMNLYYVLSEDRLYSNPMQNVIFLDNHDVQRIYTELGENMDHFKMAYGYLMTTRGIPQVYYGTELALKMGNLGGDGDKRVDMPGGWAGDDRSVFTRSGRTATENEAFDYVTKLTNWRKGNEIIHNGKLVHFIPQNNVYVFFRYSEKGKIMVIMNMNEEDAPIQRSRYIEMLRGISTGLNVISDQEIDVTKDFTVKAKTTTILELK